MIPLILGAVAAITGIYYLTKEEKKDHALSKEELLLLKQHVGVVPKLKLPTKIRFYDDGIDINSRVYEMYRNGKWHKINSDEFDYLFAFGGGHDNIEYNRKNKSEGGKFVFYRHNLKK